MTTKKSNHQLNFYASRGKGAHEMLVETSNVPLIILLLLGRNGERGREGMGEGSSTVFSNSTIKDVSAFRKLKFRWKKAVKCF